MNTERQRQQTEYGRQRAEDERQDTEKQRKVDEHKRQMAEKQREVGEQLRGIERTGERLVVEYNTHTLLTRIAAIPAAPPSPVTTGLAELAFRKLRCENTP